MSDDRPIKMHLDEPMRAHIAFVLRRYKNDAEVARAERIKQRDASDRGGVTWKQHNHAVDMLTHNHPAD